MSIQFKLDLVVILFGILRFILLLRKNSAKNIEARGICNLVICIIFAIKSVLAKGQGIPEEMIALYVINIIIFGSLFVYYDIILEIKKRKEENGEIQNDTKN